MKASSKNEESKCQIDTKNNVTSSLEFTQINQDQRSLPIQMKFINEAKSLTNKLASNRNTYSRIL